MMYDAQCCEAHELPDAVGDAAFQFVLIQVPAMRDPEACDTEGLVKAEAGRVWRLVIYDTLIS